MDDYHQKLIKSYIKKLPSPADGTHCKLEDLHVVKPKPGSVAFHRYGKEIAVTVSSENFGFATMLKLDHTERTSEQLILVKRVSSSIIIQKINPIFQQTAMRLVLPFLHTFKIQ